MNQDKVVCEGIRSLSELLKNTLINDHEFITIQEEIDNLKHYFSIQAIRYAGSFHVNYDIPEPFSGYSAGDPDGGGIPAAEGSEADPSAPGRKLRAAWFL